MSEIAWLQHPTGADKSILSGMRTVRSVGLLLGGLFMLSHQLVISQTLEGSARTVAFCTLSRQQDKYKDALVTLRARVKSFKHGTAMYDPSCPKRVISLIAINARSASVSHFYQFLQERRLSPIPILATITGRLVTEPHSSFVKQDLVFKFETVSEVSEGDNPMRRMMFPF